MRRHYSADMLSGYREGLASPRRLARIRSHLDSCAICTGTSYDLASVSVMLSQTQAPPMPDQLAARIQLALASESTARAQTSTAVPAAAGAADAEPALIPGRPDLPERTPSPRDRRRFRMPALSSPLLLRTLAATGVIVIIAGAGFLLARGEPGPPGNSSAARSNPARVVPRPTSPGGAGNATFSTTAQVDYHRDGRVFTTTALASKANLDRKTMPANVRTAVTSESAKLRTAQPAASGATTSKGVTSQSLGPESLSQLGACLTRIAAGHKVLLAEIARFIGRPAVIIVLAPFADGDPFDVSVVGLACSGSNGHVIATAKIPAS